LHGGFDMDCEIHTLWKFLIGISETGFFLGYSTHTQAPGLGYLRWGVFVVTCGGAAIGLFEKPKKMAVEPAMAKEWPLLVPVFDSSQKDARF